MRHPSELFILSLLVDQRTDAEVRRLVEAFGLPPLTDEALPYIAELRARAYATRPVGFTGVRTEDRRYLREMHVDGLHHPDMYATRALSVLQLPAARTDLFLGLIGRVNPRELASHLSNKHGLTVCTQTLRVLKHYYFNVDIIGIDEWAALLPEGGVDSARMVACLEGGPITAAYRIGLDRASNVKDAVYDIVAAVHATVQEVRNWETTPEKVRVLADSMSTLARAHTVLNTADMELAAVATELRQFKLSRSAEKPLPLALLSKDMRALPAPDMEKQSVKVK